ncbi:hypothetical protein NMG60_11019592 [Bertholletia excelsa]
MGLRCALFALFSLVLFATAVAARTDPFVSSSSYKRPDPPAHPEHRRPDPHAYPDQRHPDPPANPEHRRPDPLAYPEHRRPDLPTNPEHRRPDPPAYPAHRRPDPPTYPEGYKSKITDCHSSTEDPLKGKTFVKDFEPRPNVSIYHGDYKLQEDYSSAKDVSGDMGPKETSLTKDFEPRPNVSFYEA